MPARFHGLACKPVAHLNIRPKTAASMTMTAATTPIRMLAGVVLTPRAGPQRESAVLR